MKNRIKKGNFFKDKMVLITGGTGSFGKAFIKEILGDEYGIKRLVIYSRDELKQEEMRTMYGFNDTRLRYFIGDVRDIERLKRAMVGIDIVIHAAALKQVPACEYNPSEAISTNIIGAENVINAAIDRGVKRVVALSTDKAVNPINLYGATKLVAEKLFIQGNNYSSLNGTRFSCVRYGNVVGSRGSVVPLFKHQKMTGEITVTDKEMTRFWITLEQGVKLVINAVELMTGGEIFVPKISSMKIIDLAKLIAPEAKVKVIGIRVGEKLHEVLVSNDEAKYTYDYKDMYVVRPQNLFKELENDIWKKSKLMKLKSYSSDNNDKWFTKKEMLDMINN